MSKSRITIEVVRSGQPRAYADSERVVRVTFEVTSWRVNTSGQFEPDFTSEEWARKRLSGLMCGFIETPRSEAGFLGSYLDYLRPIDPREDGTASVWEFRTVQPFTD